MSTIMSALSIDRLIYTVPAILIAMTMHELAHGYVSYKLGDPTPKSDGRLSLNPLRHLDPLGTLCMLLFGFGWAKPVQVNPSYYDDPKAGMMWTAVAGPLMNFLMALLSLVIMAALLSVFGVYVILQNGIVSYLITLCFYTATLNVGLGVFNLIPIPPLDGSKVLAGVLPQDLYLKLMQWEPYIGMILLLVLYSGLLNAPLVGVTNSIVEAMSNLVIHLFGLY